MTDLQRVYKNQNEETSRDSAIYDHSAALMPFPYSSLNTTKEPNPDGDYIDQRMLRPMHRHEEKAILDMLQYRAKRLGEELWITTNTFLTHMGLDDLDDLRRCDLVRAVEYLVVLSSPAKA